MSQDATYEILLDQGTSHVYRSLHAGVCGPWTAPVLVADRSDAEADALRYGLMRSGTWRRARFEQVEYATAVPI